MHHGYQKLLGSAILALGIANTAFADTSTLIEMSPEQAAEQATAIEALKAGGARVITRADGSARVVVPAGVKPPTDVAGRHIVYTNPVSSTAARASVATKAADRRLQWIYAPMVDDPAELEQGGLAVLANPRPGHFLVWATAAGPAAARAAAAEAATAHAGAAVLADSLAAQSAAKSATGATGAPGEEAVDVLVHLVDDAGVKEAVGRLGAEPVAGPAQGHLVRAAARLSPAALGRLADVDGVVMVEPLAAGYAKASESAALELAGKTLFRPFVDAYGANQSLENPVYPVSVGGVHYVTNLDDLFETISEAADPPLEPGLHRTPGSYNLVTLVDTGIDNGDIDAPAMQELYVDGVNGISRYVQGFQWAFNGVEENGVGRIPQPGDNIADMMELKGGLSPLLVNPPEASDRNDTVGHGSGVVQMAIAHPRPGAGVWRDPVTGLSKSNGISPFGRFAISRWPLGPIYPGQDNNQITNVTERLYPADVIRTVGEIHRQQYYVDNNISELEKPYLEQVDAIAGLQTAIVNLSMGITGQNGTILTNYSSYAQEFDKLARNGRPSSWHSNRDAPGTDAQTLFVAAAGNSSNGDPWIANGLLNSIWNPGIAKNVLTVGGLDNFEFLFYGSSLAVIGRTDGATTTEFPQAFQDFVIGPTGVTITNSPFPSVGNPPLVVISPSIPGNPNTCTAGSFTATVSVSQNPQGLIPTEFTIFVIPYGGLVPVSVSGGDLGTPRLVPLNPGTWAITSDGNTANTAAFPELFDLTLNWPVGNCGSGGVIFISYATQSRNANTVADVSYGVDPALAYPTETGAPRKRIKPDVAAYARQVHQRDYLSLAYITAFGTSQASGMTSGAAQLSEWMLRWFYGRQTISPALLKAYVIHTARPVNGPRSGPVPGTTTRIPSPYQGYGRVGIDYALAPLPRFFVDQEVVFRKTRSEHIILPDRVYRGRIADPNAPVQVCLAWTDAPSPSVPSDPWDGVLQNNLDLLVQVRRPDGSFSYYLGNNFRAEQNNLAESVTYAYAGGTNPVVQFLQGWKGANTALCDAQNNVEMIQVPPQPAGSIVSVFVRAVELKGDALNPYGVNPPIPAVTARQDFALVVSNFEEGLLN